MKRITFIITIALATGCVHTNSYHERLNTPREKTNITVTEGPRGKSVFVDRNSQSKYDDCLSTVNRRDLGGLTADAYCRYQTDPQSSLYGMPPFGFGYSGYPGYAMPGFYGYAMPGQPDASGTPMDPRFAYGNTPQVITVATGTDQRRLSAIEKQTAENARANAELRRRLEAARPTRPVAAPEPPQPAPPPQVPASQ